MYEGNSKGRGNIYIFLYTARGIQGQIHCHFLHALPYLLHTSVTIVHKFPLAVFNAHFHFHFKPKRIPIRAFYLNDICSDALGNFQTLGHVPLHKTIFSVLRWRSSKAFPPLMTEMEC
jgi:hypothetical protein